MKILARGEKIRTGELQQKLASAGCELTVIDSTETVPSNLDAFDVVFDLGLDENPQDLALYEAFQNKPLFVSAVKMQLAAAVASLSGKPAFALFGINALPGFINRSLAEVSLYDAAQETLMRSTLDKLGWDYRIVEDRVGMITPRIVFMIVNEACYTLQEGTAGIADIDTSMKLGTNYPKGPFEWADQTGIRHVYETLQAVYDDTRDERYKICPLLKTKYLRNEKFYS